jgi:hypothetical protein
MQERPVLRRIGIASVVAAVSLCASPAQKQHGTLLRIFNREMPGSVRDLGAMAVRIIVLARDLNGGSTRIREKLANYKRMGFAVMRNNRPRTGTIASQYF